MTSADDGNTKNRAIIKKPPYHIFTENTHAYGGVGIQKT